MTRYHKHRCMTAIAVLCWLPCARADWSHLGPLTEHTVDGPRLSLHCGEATVRIEAINDNVLRIRLAPEGRFERDFSWAVLDTTPHGRFGDPSERDGVLAVPAGNLSVVVDRGPCRLTIRDADGYVLVMDEPARGMGWRRGPPIEVGPEDDVETFTEVRVWQVLPGDASIFGLGEKSGPLNKRGQAYTLWNSDSWNYGPAGDPLYKSIPFFIVRRGDRYHGILLDNPWRSTFDFGVRDRSVLSFGADGGELNYYVIAGPNPKDVIRRYTELTGRLALPPKWALGYHQSRYSYYPESRVREVARSFREKKIPCDVIYFDIDYMDGFRCFTWDTRWFPDPEDLIGDLDRMGFHTVAIIDPGIKNEPGYSVFDQGSERDAWVTRPDGQPYVGRVWPGPSVYPDFTNPKVRDWWADLFPPFIGESGLAGIWNDMNEPSDFDGPGGTVPLDMRFDNEGQPASHRAVHNVYGMQMARATYEGLLRARPNERPFTITRAAYAGCQRYGASWTGDNASTWEHLRMSITMLLNLGASGMPFIGPDIGGFVFGATPELYARWMQVGSLFPFCRTHTAWTNPDQEPWSFGPDVEVIARKALERRYALLPYIYTLFEESSRTGLPIMRPLWMEFPNIGDWYLDWVFMLGSDIYVAPVIQPGRHTLEHYLPEGIWFEFDTGYVHRGGHPIKIDAPLDRLPMFVRAGAIIPMQSSVQSTAFQPEEPLIIDVWPHGVSEGWLFEDDGRSFAYRDGQYHRTRFTCEADAESVRLTMHPPQGDYTPPARSPLLRLHGLTGSIAQVSCSKSKPAIASQGLPERAELALKQEASPAPLNEPGSFRYDADAQAWLVRMFPDDGGRQRITVNLGEPDVERVVPVRFNFDDLDGSVAVHRDIVRAVPKDGAVQFRLRGSGDPHIVLPRVRFSAEALPILKLRLSTNSTRKLGLRFSTEQYPMLGTERVVEFDVTPDGQVHDYRIDLAAAANGKWQGTVYWVRLDFADGAQPGELIAIDGLSFESK